MKKYKEFIQEADGLVLDSLKEVSDNRKIIDLSAEMLDWMSILHTAQVINGMVHRNPGIYSECQKNVLNEFMGEIDQMKILFEKFCVDVNGTGDDKRHVEEDQIYRDMDAAGHTGFHCDGH